jgi:hypothetical protein
MPDTQIINCTIPAFEVDAVCFRREAAGGGEICPFALAFLDESEYIARRSGVSEGESMTSPELIRCIGAICFRRAIVGSVVGKDAQRKRSKVQKERLVNAKE